MWQKSKNSSQITKKSSGGYETLENRMIKVEGEDQSMSDGKLELMSFNESMKAGFIGKIFGKKPSKISQSKCFKLC
jgi:hypothetical protein